MEYSLEMDCNLAAAVPNFMGNVYFPLTQFNVCTIEPRQKFYSNWSAKSWLAPPAPVPM